MAQAHFRRLVLATLTLLACTSAVEAQTQKQKQAPPSDISGRWRFKTVLEAKGCVITGVIEFRKAAKPFDYVCSFHSREDCGRTPPTFTEVDQSCSVQVLGGEIAITSKVEKITSAGPSDFADYMTKTQSYYADNFLVHYEKGELVGLFHSQRQAPVRFWRDEQLVS